MSGKHFRDEISARADGEDPGVPDEEIDAHLSRCESCRDFARTTAELRRHLEATVLPAVPDHGRDVVGSIGRDERRRSSTSIRWLLTICALVVIAVAIPAFFSTEITDHSMRHIAAFRIAYGAGLLGVVIRPARARTMFHVSVVLVVALASTTLVDLFTDGLELAPESLHLVQVLTAVLLWMLARPPADDSSTMLSMTKSPNATPDDVPTDTASPTGIVVPLHNRHHSKDHSSGT